MASDRATVELERGGVSLVLEVGILALDAIEAVTRAPSAPAPSPWAVKGFSWDDAWALRRLDRGHYVAFVEGRNVTIWNDTLDEALPFTVPEGSDARLFVWNKLCELSLHGCTADDAFDDGGVL
jgi:hypothetical protein